MPSPNRRRPYENIASEAEAMARIQSAARELERHPTPSSAKATIRRLLNDLEDTPASAPAPKRARLLLRLGKFLVAPVYRVALKAMLETASKSREFAVPLFVVAQIMGKKTVGTPFYLGTIVFYLLSTLTESEINVALQKNTNRRLAN